MESLWEKTARRSSFPEQAGDLDTEVLIIGGGMCGLLCAHRLQEAGVDYVLAEAGELCGGITKNTTAKITAQHGLIYEKLIRTFGPERAKLYLQANQEAVEDYGALCQGLDCGFRWSESYVYSLDSREKILGEVRALETLGQKAEFREEVPLPLRVAGAVGMERQAQFHPLNFAQAIARGLNIREHTRVEELIGTTAKTNRGTIRAKKIIVATHFPFLNKHGMYFMKLYQSRSYVLALENTPKVEGMYVDENQKGMSFRSYGDVLLVGGGDHRTGKQGGGWRELRSFVQREYPGAVERAHWATQDCMSLDGVPYIGPYAKHTQGLYVATGFNKWGMTSSMVASKILCDQVMGRENRYSALFDPGRSMLRPQLAANAWESTIHLVKPGKPRCPHLGCALEWNPQERSWDCPCHGSRFTAEGKLLDNPATGDLGGEKNES